MYLVVSLLCLTVILAVLIILLRGYGSLGRLADFNVWDGASAPLVTIIVPACNEENSIESGLASLARQGYPNLEIIVVNDRSTDRTAEAIERVRRAYPAITLMTVSTLPDGWLGKPHAMKTAAQAARGEYLIFTDADVCLDASTVSRSVRVMQEKELDHLTLIFQNSGGSPLLNALISDSGAGLLFLLKPWKAKDPASRCFVGIGAFNMVRRSVYREIGGHETIRMQVIDDVFLGKRVKQGGFRQDCLLAQEYVTLPWYATVGEMVSGLMKNVYSFFYYRAWLAFAGVFCIAAALIMPFWLVFISGGAARYVFLLAVLLRIGGIGAGMIRAGVTPAAVPYLFLTPYISAYIILRAVWIAHRSGGITWRGQFYPLTALKKNEWLFAGIFSSSR